jgi:ribosomal protein L28
MSRRCEICGKGSMKVNTRKLLRGNYNLTGTKRQKPNLQPTTVEGLKVKACTTCIRTIAKQA